MNGKHLAGTTEKLIAQEEKMRNIMYAVSVCCDITADYLKNNIPIDHNTGHPITMINSPDDALRFSVMMEHVKKMERQITFKDNSAILITDQLLHGLLEKAHQKNIVFSSEKLILLIILVSKVLAIENPHRKDIKSETCMFILEHLKDYLKAKQTYEDLLLFSIDQETEEIDQLLIQAAQEQKILTAPLKVRGAHKTPLSIKVLLAAGFLSAAGLAEWKYVEHTTNAAIRTTLTEKDLPPAERIRIWNDMDIQFRKTMEKEELSNIQAILSSTITTLLIKDNPLEKIPVFTPAEINSLHNAIDSAFFRLSTLNNTLEPDQKTITGFYEQLDLVIQESLATQMVLPAAYLFTHKTATFKYISLAEVNTFIQKYQIASKPLSPLEIAKIGIAINIYGYRTALDPRLLLCIMWRESNFDTDAFSPANARGYMQIMPAQFKDLGITNWRDPFQNIRAGTYHLYALAQSWITGHENELLLALASYNTGTGNVIDFLSTPTLSIKFTGPRGLNFFIEKTLYQKSKYQYRNGYLKMWGVMRATERDAWLEFLTTAPERLAIQKLWEESQKKPYRVDFHSFNEFAPDILKKFTTYPWKK